MLAPSHPLKGVIPVAMIALGAKGWTFLSSEFCWEILPMPLSPTICAGLLVLE